MATYRKTVFAPGQIYHVFNRSIAKQPIFHNTRDYQRALDTLIFYSYSNPIVRFSHYNRLSSDKKSEFMKNLRDGDRKRIELLAFCLMPNHIHFLIKEVTENGISTFMSNLQNSYAKYFNQKTVRTGSLFQTMFKAVRIETDEQLVHVARYIHLNPVTAYILKDINQLKGYLWSSFIDYIGLRNLDILNKDLVLGYFSSIEQFISFTNDQIDYQRELDQIKHLTLE